MKTELINGNRCRKKEMEPRVTTKVDAVGHGI